MAREAPDYGNGRGNPGATEVIEEAQLGADSSLADALAPQLSLDTGDERVQKAAPGLADKFIVPPFTVLDTRSGYWQERRRAWLSLGMRGETGRGDGLALNTAELNAGGLKGDMELGRDGGLIYQHNAPASDPAFYDKKRKVEADLGRTITTEEFRRDHYRRDEQTFGQSASMATGTSVFDPVLCEIAYRWFSAEGALVVDPFAGGVVRGLLAGILGRQYVGVELRPEQIADNRAQADRLLGGDLNFGRQPLRPVWFQGDAQEVETYGFDPADLIFTCPPYADLEVYSDDPKDLSTMDYRDFRLALLAVMKQTAAILKPDRFAVWVVGEARDKKTGMEYGFVADTVRAAQAAGLGLYNSAILLNSVGSAALRAQRIVRTRKLTRVHQHVLVFVKGDPKRAAAACGSAEVEA
jgi:hypothetical protein